MLLEEFLRPLGLTQVEFAQEIGVPIQRLNTLIRGKRGVTADTAIRLAKRLNMPAEFWLGLQVKYDLWHALQAYEKQHAPSQATRTTKTRTSTQVTSTKARLRTTKAKKATSSRAA
jgi:addiction module HigA family antidote